MKFDREALRSYVERIERLEEEKRTIADDIKAVYAEAKAAGFDTRVLRKVIARRRRDRNEIAEEEALMSLYMNVLDLTPLERLAALGDADDGGEAQAEETA